MTFTGTFANDASNFNYTLTNTATTTYNFYTPSYGGGTNANGTVTAAGGFDPVLTLFSSTGNVVGFGGGSGTCSGSSKADATTGLCEDAYLSTVLAPGTYSLYLTEFPNVAVGMLSDGFLAAGDATFTGDNCGVSGGTFLQSDVAPCVQRSANYAVNVASITAVPEPSTLVLMLPAAAAFARYGRRIFAHPVA
jgi:hypothetical protein